MFAKIDVLVAATSPDVQAEGIAAAVAACPDMTLAANRVLTGPEAESLLRAMPRSSPCALVLVGMNGYDDDELEELSAAWSSLVVLRVDVIGDRVQIALHDVGLDALLRALRELLGRWDRPPRERRSHFALRVPSHDSRIRHIEPRR